MRVAALTMSYNEPVWAGVWGHGDDLGQKLTHRLLERFQPDWP